MLSAKGDLMRIRKHWDLVELLADNKKETELLREMFHGTDDTCLKVLSFGYDRKMPRRTKELQYWAERQQLTIKLHKSS